VKAESRKQKAESRKQKAEMYEENRHPESAKRDEGSQVAKCLQFRDPSPSSRLRMTAPLESFCFLPSAF
jgi:hypothetical protein